MRWLVIVFAAPLAVTLAVFSMSSMQVGPLVYHDGYGQRAGAISDCFIVRYHKLVSGDNARCPPSWTGPVVPNEHGVPKQVEILMFDSKLARACKCKVPTEVDAQKN